MFPQIRQIQRLVVEEHVEQDASVGAEGFANGIGTLDLAEDADGCEERSVCEYRQTGQLLKAKLACVVRVFRRRTDYRPIC
jgi:hypothetical protein